MPDISVDKAYLLALFLESLLYGVFAILLMFCLNVLIARRQGDVPWAIVIPACLMFLLSSAHVSIVLVRTIQGFIERAGTPGGAAQYFMEITNPLNVANQFIYACNNIVGDSIVIWRCYVVWERDIKIIVLPTLLLLATMVTSFMAAYEFSHANEGVFSPVLDVWAKAFFSITLSTNLLVTTLIASRICEWLGRKLKTMNPRTAAHSTRYWRILILIIESGMIYSACLLIDLILYAAQTNAIFITFDSMAQVTGIVPTLIIALVGLGMTRSDTTAIGTQASIHFRAMPHNRGLFEADTFGPHTFSEVEFQVDSRQDIQTPEPKERDSYIMPEAPKLEDRSLNQTLESWQESELARKGG